MFLIYLLDFEAGRKIAMCYELKPFKTSPGQPDAQKKELPALGQ